MPSGSRRRALGTGGHARSPSIARPGAAAVLLAVALAATPARADGGTILLLLEPDAGTFGSRLRAELESVGFMVVEGPLGAAGLDVDDLLARARAAHAAAAVLVKPAREATEIWVVDRITGKTVRREVPTSAPRDDAVLVTKTTELLRASLLEIDVPGFEPAEVPPPAPARVLLPAPAPARGAVLLGAGATLGGPLGTTVYVRVGLAARAFRWLWAGARLGLPVTRPSVDGPEGRASVFLSGAEAFLEAAPLREHWATPIASIAAGAVWLRASGTASPPYTSLTGNVFSAALGARAGVSFHVVGRLRLRLEGGASALLPRPRILFAGRVAGAAPQPLPDAGGALELDAW